MGWCTCHEGGARYYTACFRIYTIFPVFTNWQFNYLSRRLLIILGFKKLFATHCTYGFLVCTGLTVMRTHLMHILPTDTTSFKFCCVRTKSEFATSNGFIFADLATTTFHSVSCSRLPWVWCNDSSKFLLAFLTNHIGPFRYKQGFPDKGK